MLEPNKELQREIEKWRAEQEGELMHGGQHVEKEEVDDEEEMVTEDLGDDEDLY